MPATVSIQSARYLDDTPSHSEGSTLDITWRQHLDLSPSELARRLSGARVKLASAEATLPAHVEALSACTARVEEYRTAITNGPDEIAVATASAARGEMALIDLAISKARIDMARDLLPACVTQHRELQHTAADAQRAAENAKAEIAALEVAQSFRTLRKSLPMDALAEWFRASGDQGLVLTPNMGQ